MSDETTRGPFGPEGLPPLDELLASESARFSDGLVFTFELSSEKTPKPVVVNGHNIVSFSLDLRRSGFAGEVRFKMVDDTTLGSTEEDLLVSLFRTPQLLKIRFGIAPEQLESVPDPGAPTEPLEVMGLVTEKLLIEQTVRHMEGAPLSHRLYHVRFADPAQVLWRQHFPLALYTETSLADVITANSNKYVTVQFPDTTMTAVQPLIFLGLDPRNRPSERASFYDLVMWRLDETARMWIFDYAQKVYQIHKTKLPPAPIPITPDDVEEIFTYYPPPPRHGRSLLNDYTEQVQNREVTSANPQLTENLVAGVRQDALFGTAIATEFESELEERAELFTLPKPDFVLRYRLFPSAPFAPGVGVNFAPEQIDFASETVLIPPEALAEPCRVYRVSMSGTTLEKDVLPDYDGKVAGRFACRVNVWIETAANPEPRLPAYVTPKYPVHIQGKVLSEVGQPQEETYQFYPDPVTSLNRYKITIPLWADQIITVPYNPNMDPGHFYFPAYKHERVLIAFYYDHAFLKRFLDWRPTAQLPLETQGDQLLLGKTPVNRTSVRHTYQNELPVFEIERLNMLKSFDTELLQMSEGSMLLSVGTPLGAPPPGVSMSQQQPQQPAQTPPPTGAK